MKKRVEWQIRIALSIFAILVAYLTYKVITYTPDNLKRYNDYLQNK